MLAWVVQNKGNEFNQSDILLSLDCVLYFVSDSLPISRTEELEEVPRDHVSRLLQLQVVRDALRHVVPDTGLHCTVLESRGV